MTSTNIKGVYLPSRDTNTLWDLTISPDGIESITPHQSLKLPNAPTTIALPSLCHPHVHLDKPFLLSSALPQYTPFTPKTGEFSEALQLTGAAKSRFTRDDLVQRGEWLIAESVQAGVTHMRAFVEVDVGVGKLGIEVAKALKERWKDVVYLQICAFAQDPVFSREHAQANRKLMKEILGSSSGAEVLGTTPYVESGRKEAAENVKWAIELAIEKRLGLDFHLDYNVDINECEQGAMLHEVIEQLEKKDWVKKCNKTICIGHCTRTTLAHKDGLQKLADQIAEARLPIYFIGLPTSDLYMMGRPKEYDPWKYKRERGTLQVVDMIKENGMNAAIGINNVGNAFTPWGNCDPLALASLGVGLYHSGTPADAKLLYECVSARARRAIGIGTADEADLNNHEPADILLVRTGEEIDIGGLKVVSRPLCTVEEVVWNPPPIGKRRVFFSGTETRIR
ncbi:MAG: hypothetical protein Q9160_006249 [Pyrenula sp. 1 TL-2023]